MIELPEAVVLAQQSKDLLCGKRIMNVTVEQSPHKFAWYYGEKESFQDLLSGREITDATGFGSMVEIRSEKICILFGEGVRLRFHAANEKHPQKHQLLVEFEDFSALSASVQMYGGLGCFREGSLENIYYDVAKEKPSPLKNTFDEEYFESIISAPGAQKLSAKALLATEQRIPGLGNGVLQDILYCARIHPKRQVKTLTNSEQNTLYHSILSTLNQMVFQGGRDTETDLYGCPGGYKTILSRKTADTPCPACGTPIKKEAYLGGSIYFCATCQPL